MKTIFAKYKDQLFEVIVDDHLYNFLMQYSWRYDSRTRRATTSINNRAVPMHRLIYKHFIGPVPKGNVIDHINRNRLDNRIENLRLATASQNRMNSTKKRNSKNKYKGVAQDKGSRKWKAYIGYNKKQIHIGMFETEEEAYQAYLIKAKELFGEFAEG